MIHLNVHHNFVNLWHVNILWDVFSVHKRFLGRDMWYGVVAVAFCQPLFGAYWSFKKEHPAIVIIFIENDGIS